MSKNKVDVETNNLLCTIEWMTPVHDGPVNMMLKSPFMDHLLLTMGGYSFAIWNEGIMNKPVIMHYVDKEQFTAVAWSIEQPNILFFSGMYVDCRYIVQLHTKVFYRGISLEPIFTHPF